MEGARMVPQGGVDARHAAPARAQGAVAVLLHDPPRQPRGRSRRRPEGRRAPGFVGLAGDADDGALFPRPAARGPGGGEAARQPGVPRHPVPARQPDARQAAELPRLRRRAVLSLAHQGHGRRRFLHRLGGPRRRRDGLCQPRAGLRARQGLEPELAQGPHDRASWAMPRSTKATCTRRCSNTGSTASRTAGGSSTTTARAWTRWSPTACS